MGHYYADLACKKCGQIRCCCPSIIKTPPQWMVDTRDWTVRLVVHGDLMNIFAPKFDSQEEAEAAIPDMIAKKREELLAEADILDMMLNLKPSK